MFEILRSHFVNQDKYSLVVLNLTPGAREIAQWAKYLLYKHDDRGLDHQNP